MTISAADVKLFESQRLTQNPDGGGRQTGNEVIDGQVNNLFQDISRVNRAFGNVALIKAFLGVDTQTTDIYLGAHGAVVRRPDDPNVSATLFSTESDTDERQDARDFIESYVVAGPEARMTAFGAQLAGSRSIEVYQRLDAPLPDVGSVYVLSDEDGQGNAAKQQYVRVRDVNAEVRTFLESGAEFERRVVRIDIGSPLRDTYEGSTPERNGNEAKPTRIRETNVADAARYYGIATLTEQADSNSVDLNVDDVYQQLVPVTETSTPVTDQQAGGTRPVTITSGGQQIEIQQVSQTLQRPIQLANRDYNYVFILDPIPAVGSLVVEYRALGKWETLRDDGTGKLEGAGTGQIDFQSGSLSVTLKALPDVDTQLIVSWAEPSFYFDRSGSQSIEPPEIFHQTAKEVLPGSVTVSWLVGGNPRSVTDNGDGTLSGDGTGRIVYATLWKKVISPDGKITRTQLANPIAEISVRPTEFPDGNSEITVDYEGATRNQDTFNPSKDGGGNLTVTAGTTPLKPGSVQLQWTATMPARDRRRSGEGVLKLKNGTVAQPNSSQFTITVNDDGNGGFADLPNATVDYSTGEVIFDPQRPYEYKFQYQGLGFNWTTHSGAGGGSASTGYVNGGRNQLAALAAPTVPSFSSTITRNSFLTFADGDLVTLRYHEDSATGTANSETAELPPVEVDLLPDVTDVIVPGTVKFQWLGSTYSDRGSGGVLYDSGGIAAGSIDYDAGKARISIYAGGGTTNIITINTLVSSFGFQTLDRVRFRAPGSPLQPGGLVIQATRRDTGDLIQATSDLSGVIDSAYMKGEVDYDTGFVTLAFGQVVADSSLTTEEKSEPWYDPDAVDDNGDIWKPEQVFPNTIRYSAVIRSILPLDADILGLDPVRLPGDGRVPIFRPGYLLLVHNPETFTMPSPLSADQVVTLPRGNLSHVRMLDANENPVPGGTGEPTDQWALDKAAGEITIADIGTLDTTTYPEPWIAEHVVDDLVLAADVQINGQIQIVGGLTHTFPANDSYVSSVMIFGDLQARVANFFEQATWQSSWKDSVQGSEPDASYNNVTYPVEVLNADAITERWALVFDSSSSGEIIGETVGVIGTFSISSDVAPINPNTGQPYFTVRSDGFGIGWNAGNAIRFNTVGANAPMWIARTVLSGATELEKDRFRLQLRGDAD